MWCIFSITFEWTVEKTLKNHEGEQREPERFFEITWQNDSDFQFLNHFTVKFLLTYGLCIYVLRNPNTVQCYYQMRLFDIIRSSTAGSSWKRITKTILLCSINSWARNQTFQNKLSRGKKYTRIQVFLKNQITSRIKIDRPENSAIRDEHHSDYEKFTSVSSNDLLCRWQEGKQESRQQRTKKRVRGLRITVFATYKAGEWFLCGYNCQHL